MKEIKYLLDNFSGIEFEINGIIFYKVNSLIHMGRFNLINEFYLHELGWEYLDSPEKEIFYVVTSDKKEYLLYKVYRRKLYIYEELEKFIIE